MSDIVIDANVWAMADRVIRRGLPLEEENCIRACRDWLERFVSSADRLVVDWEYEIISEYRRNIRRNGFAEQLLNRIESVSHMRFLGVSLEVDKDNHAVLPVGLTIGDPADRKYVAAAIQCNPNAPIYNATDTDLSMEHDKLTDYGLTIHELCPDYIAQLMAEQ